MKRTSRAGQLQMTVVTSTPTAKRRNTAGKVSTKATLVVGQSIGKTKATKTAKIEVAPATPPANPNAWKNAKHNKKFRLEKVSRTEMVEIINATNGKFFTSTHIDATGHARTMNCIKSAASAPDALGMLTVYSVMDKGYRIINPQTLTDLSFGKVHYYSGRKPKA